MSDSSASFIGASSPGAQHALASAGLQGDAKAKRPGAETRIAYTPPQPPAFRHWMPAYQSARRANHLVIQTGPGNHQPSRQARRAVDTDFRHPTQYTNTPQQYTSLHQR